MAELSGMASRQVWVPGSLSLEINHRGQALVRARKMQHTEDERLGLYPDYILTGCCIFCVCVCAPSSTHEHFQFNASNIYLDISQPHWDGASWDISVRYVAAACLQLLLHYPPWIPETWGLLWAFVYLCAHAFLNFYCIFLNTSFSIYQSSFCFCFLKKGVSSKPVKDLETLAWKNATSVPFPCKSKCYF